LHCAQRLPPYDERIGRSIHEQDMKLIFIFVAPLKILIYIVTLWFFGLIDAVRHIDVGVLGL